VELNLKEFQRSETLGMAPGRRRPGGGGLAARHRIHAAGRRGDLGRGAARARADRAAVRAVAARGVGLEFGMHAAPCSRALGSGLAAAARLLRTPPGMATHLAPPPQPALQSAGLVREAYEPDVLPRPVRPARRAAQVRRRVLGRRRPGAAVRVLVQDAPQPRVDHRAGRPGRAAAAAVGPRLRGRVRRPGLAAWPADRARHFTCSRSWRAPASCCCRARASLSGRSRGPPKLPEMRAPGACWLGSALQRCACGGSATTA